jgi:predicted aspartyl protease
MKQSLILSLSMVGVVWFCLGRIDPARSQDDNPCYMVSPSGRVVNLNRLCGGNSATPATTSPTVNNTGVFQVPIKRRQGGTPVIDVTFNGRRTFEMLVDTGASFTKITPQMATAIGFVATGSQQFQIANGEFIQSPVGRVASISVGGAVVSNATVSVGAVPLLGQNFFNNYDVTIRRNVIEFRVR